MGPNADGMDGMDGTHANAQMGPMHMELKMKNEQPIPAKELPIGAGDNFRWATDGEFLWKKNEDSAWRKVDLAGRLVKDQHE
ncbi:hypothetical protein LCGC14_3158750 [marine sediment metagenome]|uniref:Uncharacterized protein n=1 Tax=marine sediment metagenome TaxID=412755 RepID=A0A0F8WFX6_9ZZZZ